jgi:hypothetical protein
MEPKAPVRTFSDDLSSMEGWSGYFRIEITRSAWFLETPPEGSAGIDVCFYSAENSV